MWRTGLASTVELVRVSEAVLWLDSLCLKLRPYCGWTRYV